MGHYTARERDDGFGWALDLDGREVIALSSREAVSTLAEELNSGRRPPSPLDAVADRIRSLELDRPAGCVVTVDSGQIQSRHEYDRVLVLNGDAAKHSVPDDGHSTMVLHVLDGTERAVVHVEYPDRQSERS